MIDKMNIDSKVMKREIVKTDDGSTSLSIPEMDEMYHSRKGAIKESVFIYINHGLNAIKKDNISILEIGMGTGLNCALAYEFAKKHKIIGTPKVNNSTYNNGYHPKISKYT